MEVLAHPNVVDHSSIDGVAKFALLAYFARDFGHLRLLLGHLRVALH